MGNAQSINADGSFGACCRSQRKPPELLIPRALPRPVHLPHIPATHDGKVPWGESSQARSALTGDNDIVRYDSGQRLSSSDARDSDVLIMSSGGYPDHRRGVHSSTNRPSRMVSVRDGLRLVGAFFQARQAGDTTAALDLIAEDAVWEYPPPKRPLRGKSAIAEHSILKVPQGSAPGLLSIDQKLSSPYAVVVVRETSIDMGQGRYFVARNEVTVESRWSDSLGAYRAPRLLITRHRLKEETQPMRV